MKYRYFVIQETYMAEEMTRTAYGIAAAVEQDECLVVLQSFSDVCAESEGLEKLARLCNDLDLDCIHFQDVVEDFIAEH